MNAPEPVNCRAQDHARGSHGEKRQVDALDKDGKPDASIANADIKMLWQVK